MKILFFSDIHFHDIHRFSIMTDKGFTTRELEHLSCADDIEKICKNELIDKIVFGGDLYYTVGNNISCQTQTAVTKFFERLLNLNIPIDLLVGNHDLSMNTNTYSIHKLIPYKHWPNFNVYDEPKEVDNFIYMPFCTSDEYAESFLQNIEDKANKIVFSHLEIKNFELGNGLFTKKGVDLNLLKQFKMVLQGHYHCGGKLAKNIQISGSTQRLSFKDHGISRNNIILYDTDSNKIERRSFNCPDWLVFDDNNIEEVLNIDNNNYVKVDVTMDILLTDEIKEKLKNVLKTDIHIDLTRIKTNKEIKEELDDKEDEKGILTQFIMKSDNSPEQKEQLVEEGNNLIERAKK